MAVVTILGRSYESKSDHRDNTAAKSQWTITLPEEHECFRLAMSEGWSSQDWAWGLHVVDDKPYNLGLAAIAGGTPARELFIALFELGNASHGYPADHQRSDKEKPPSQVRADWLQRGLIRKAKLRKIALGQRCTL